MSVIQPNNEENRSLCCRVITHPGTQAAVSAASAAGSVTTGMLMLSGAIAVNAIPIAGQAICIALVAIWIIGSLVSYFHAVDRWEKRGMEEAFRERDIQILHPKPQPSDVEMVPFETIAGETSTGEEEEVPGEGPQFISPNYKRQRTDAQGDPVSLEMTSVPRKPYVRQLPMPHMITFADLHASIGEEIRRKTAATAADEESDGEQPGNDSIPKLDLTGVVIEDATEEPTEREPLYFPKSQERTPAHLSLVPFHSQQTQPIIEYPETPRESDNWMLVPLASPRAEGPRIVEISEEEFQALKEAEQIRRQLAERRKRKGMNGQLPKTVYPAIEAPVIPVNTQTLESRKLLAQMAKERAARQKIESPLAPFTLRARPETPDAPESPVPVSRCGQFQQKAWDVLERGQNLLNRGLDRLPTWVFQRIDVR